MERMPANPYQKAEPVKIRKLLSIEEFIDAGMEKGTLTMGDVNLAAAELGKEIRAAERAGTAEDLEPRRQLLKRLEIAQKALLAEATERQEKASNEIKGFGTKRAEGISELPFHEISAVEAVRQADPASWQEEPEESDEELARKALDLIGRQPVAEASPERTERDKLVEAAMRRAPTVIDRPAPPGLAARIAGGIKSLFERTG